MCIDSKGNCVYGTKKRSTREKKKKKETWKQKKNKKEN